MFGRIFTLCWVLIGLVIISIFTATITTSLTSLSLSNDVTLYGKNLVALKRTEEFSYGVRNNNNMKSTDTIDEFVHLVKSQKDEEDNQIHGGLLDAYRAGYVRDKLSQNNGIKFATVVDHQFVYGFVVSRNLMNSSLHICLKRTLSMKENTITSIIQKDMVPLEKPEKSEADETSSNLFDPESPMFQHCIFVCLGIIGTLSFGGFIWEYFYYRPKHKKTTTETIEKIEDDVVALETTPTCSYEDVIRTQCRLFEEKMIEEVLSFHRAFLLKLDGIKYQNSCRTTMNEKPTDFELSRLHLFHGVGDELSSDIYK